MTELQIRGPIVLIGTLDTKGHEILYLKQLLETAGARTLIVDVGVLAKGPFASGITRDEIARHAGTSLDELQRAGDRGNAIAAMERGAAAWIADQHRRDPVAGIIGIGGSAGTTIATSAMRRLPVGIPKVMVSTLASGNTRPYVGTSDIAMMYSVADFTGLNRLTRVILSNAANAVLGMCGLSRPGESANAPERPLLGATMFGVTTPCVNQIRELLERQGFELLVFHATGTGGQAMEQLIGDGFLSGVLDITTTEWADELVGGVLSAGPQRLAAAARAGVPQVVSVGALDMVNFGAPDTVPARFSGRKFYQHNPTVTLMRTTAEENAKLGRVLAEKLNAASGPVVLLLPLGGVSAIDAPGQPFHDPDADSALFAALRQHLAPRVKLVEMQAHINDAAFAERAVTEFVHIARGSNDGSNS